MQFHAILVELLMVKVGCDDSHKLGGVFQFGPAELWYMVEQEIENIAATEGGKNQRKIYVSY